VKITVIATGFDRRVAARPAPNAATTTPVDLSSYSQHLSRAAAEAVAAAPAHAKARSTMSTADSGSSSAAIAAPGSGFALNRRPGVELSLGAPGVAAMGAAEETAIEHSLFDVPAFLRRQN